jgi:hypothetical protein
VSPAAQGAIDQRGPRPNREPLDDLIEHYGNVDGHGDFSVFGFQFSV